MVFGTGTGAGIQTVNPGDKYGAHLFSALPVANQPVGKPFECCCCRYEGEFFAGFANGLGAYTSMDGEVYRGEWLYGKRHG